MRISGLATTVNRPWPIDDLELEVWVHMRGAYSTLGVNDR